MSMLTNALRLVGAIWLSAAGLLIVFSHLVVLHMDGFWAFVNLMNPWNVASALTLHLTVAPGLLLRMAADQLSPTTFAQNDLPAIDPAH
ncbi:hypothetical protein S58_14780 [Bradyrhizobium oligotrophicum S58]|uniref:Uncharacterized protein n=1 Tax=Bradyrhizobium oligotrophicum S58 TaxID=1245469 RepID=M4Z3P8_9BRAD|nr:hypothetical protein [Bradyrhizobium oligotrophicum]BAM87486.1 hypothetical protein S58_14780 [Bradyrhizobium oligotrophicum S58]